MLGVAQARAELITFYFGGEITSVDDPNGTLGGAVQVNDAWSGSYTFESTTPDLYPGTPEIGRYESSAASMSMTLGTLTIEAQGTQCSIGIFDEAEGDYFAMECSGFYQNDIPVGELGFSLRDSTGAPLPATLYLCCRLR